MTGTPTISRRNALLGVGAIAAVAGVAACDDNSGGNSNAETKTVANVNGLTDAQGSMTIDAYDACIENPECQYPAKQMTYSTELNNQRKKLLTLNHQGLQGWLYCFLPGVGLVMEVEIAGKPSNMDSSMTADVGVYQDRGGNGGGNIAVQLPGDDLSLGPNEPGIFAFTPEGAMITWHGPYMYTTAKLITPPTQVQYDKNATPSFVAP